MKDMREVLFELDPRILTPADVIKAIRHNFEITQEEVCQITGLKKSNLSAIENGKIQMTVHYAEILGAALGIHPMTILFPNGRNFKSKEIKDIEKKADIFFKKKRKLLK